MAKKLGFITTVTTNGLLYPKKAESLSGLIDMLHFSLDSYNRDQHDTMRGVKCYDAILESIDIALQLGERPDILFTVFTENFAQIAPVYKNIVLPNNLVLILNPAFDYNDVNTGESLSREQLQQLKSWRKKPLVYLNKAFITLIEDGGNHIENPVCKAGSSTIVISPENGLIAPCFHLQKSSFPIDNQLIKVYSQRETRKALAQEGVLPECEGCTVNCYMQPSFAVKINKYFWQALPGTIKYNRMKGTWKRLFFK
jgi:MoaA/NifB/PqqE/SkfB family radical SAM enzyme